MLPVPPVFDTNLPDIWCLIISSPMKTVMRSFRLKPTAAIMCCGKPASGPGPLKTHTFDVDPATSPAYDTDYGEATVSIFGEWERLPAGGVFPEIDEDFVAQLYLTEESFH